MGLSSLTRFYIQSASWWANPASRHMEVTLPWQAVMRNGLNTDQAVWMQTIGIPNESKQLKNTTIEEASIVYSLHFPSLWNCLHQIISCVSKTVSIQCACMMRIHHINERSIYWNSYTQKKYSCKISYKIPCFTSCRSISLPDIVTKCCLYVRKELSGIFV